jgi:hypothetical protein
MNNKRKRKKKIKRKLGIRKTPLCIQCDVT